MKIATASIRLSQIIKLLKKIRLRPHDADNSVDQLYVTCAAAAMNHARRAVNHVQIASCRHDLTIALCPLPLTSDFDLHETGVLLDETVSLQKRFTALASSSKMRDRFTAEEKVRR